MVHGFKSPSDVEGARNALLTEMKERLLRAWGQDISRIILYGSHAKAEARPDSDFDLLVVYRNGLSRREARRRLREALGDLRPFADLRVVTEEQYQAGRNRLGCLVEAADRSGQILHGP
jgi:uncharacterized protein